MIAYVCCVALWIVFDAVIERGGGFMFEHLMRLPLVMAFGLLDSDVLWLLIAHYPSWSVPPMWSIGTVIFVAYTAVGFLPLILVPLLKRKWPLWLTGAFVLAHPGLWFLSIIFWLSGHHP